MAIARQLYHLQELDQQIDAEEMSLRQKTGQLCESPALIAAREKLTSAQQKLADLKKRQKIAEHDAEDLTAKIKVIDEKLYGGKVRNPKELTDLQHEGQALRARRNEIEGSVLEMMEQMEPTESAAATANRDFQTMEQDWQADQRRLATEIEQVKARLAEVKTERQAAAAEIDTKMLELYQKLRKQKGQALARIEQGICRGCRISLSSNEIQQARSGNLVQCSSCGRILYLP